jgi:hypothetical protein
MDIILPDNYNFVTSNSPEYPLNFCDKNTTPDGDLADAVPQVDNFTGITVCTSSTICSAQSPGWLC